MKLNEIFDNYVCFNEAYDYDTTITTIVSDMGSSINDLYAKLTNQAQAYYRDHGDLAGFGMVSGGTSSRWVNDVYVRSLKSNLWDLTKFKPKQTGNLKLFLQNNVGKVSFSTLSRELPEILSDIAQQLQSPRLMNAANNWKHQRDVYIKILNLIQQDKDVTHVGKQSGKQSGIEDISKLRSSQEAEATKIINDVLANPKISPQVSHEIRMIVDKSDNKLLTLQRELNNRKIIL